LWVLVWILYHVAQNAPRILRWLLKFWISYLPLFTDYTTLHYTKWLPTCWRKHSASIFQIKILVPNYMITVSKPTMLIQIHLTTQLADSDYKQSIPKKNHKIHVASLCSADPHLPDFQCEGSSSFVRCL
jgi:hypothetical protein